MRNRDWMRYARILIAVGTTLSMGVPVSAAQSTHHCSPSTKSTIIGGGNVQAIVFNNGMLYWSRSRSVYEVPKHSGLGPMFSASLWVGGTVEDEIRVSGSTYGPFEFWSGPVDSLRAGQPCASLDRMYSAALRDINALREGIEPSVSVARWPVGWGASSVERSVAALGQTSVSRTIPLLYGSEMAYWVMNDVGAEHDRFRSAPLQVEVRVRAFATYSDDRALDSATFYVYEVENVGSTSIEDAYIGWHADMDLGYWGDDYVGSDSLLHLVYAYNGSNFDGDRDGKNGYGEAPPAFGFQILDGPVADRDGFDNDRDGTVDESGESLGLSSMMTLNHGGAVLASPIRAEQAYQLMQARWRDGKRLTFGGDGRHFSDTPTNFMFSGDPPAYWSELNVDDEGTGVPPSDRRITFSIGPFDLEPGQTESVFMAGWYARGSNHLDSVQKLKDIASRMRGLRPEDVGSDAERVRLSIAPDNRVPADGVANQAAELKLSWRRVPHATGYQVRVMATDGSTSVREINTDSLHATVNLENDTEYRWKVRAYTPTDYGPWSATSTFSTGTIRASELKGIDDVRVVQNANGPLSSPAGATAHWQGFPGEPPGESQQAGPARWLFHADSHSGSDSTQGSYAHFLDRIFRRGSVDYYGSDYEIRFGPEGYAWDVWNTGDVQRVPFEIWSIGSRTPNDSSDDYRMIPLYNDKDGDGWGLVSDDHPVSVDADDPYTDPLYFYDPEDTSPGTEGYDAWLRHVLAGGEPAEKLGREHIARSVLVNWDGLDIGTGSVAQELPEAGTTFRIVLPAQPRPILMSPAPEVVLTEENAYFFWDVVPDETATLEVARDRTFNNLIFAATDLEPGLELPLLATLDPGRYYWRVRAEQAGLSETGTYLVGTNVGNESVADPTGGSVLHTFPNPVVEKLTARLSTSSRTQAEITVFDILGREVSRRENIDLTSTSTDIPIDVSRLASGAYILVAQLGSERLRSSFIVAGR